MRLLVLALLCAAPVLAQQARPVYRDPKAPLEKRVEDLLRRMTIEEKIGQMNMPCLYLAAMGRTLEEKREACRRFTAGSYAARVGPGGGFFTLANHIATGGPRDQASFFNELQRIAIEKTRLGIPLLQTEEGTHGLMCAGGTIFPEGPGLGSTWNTALIERVYAAAAAEARAVGIHQLFTLVVEPIRDPRLGRNEEAYSEDPYLCSRFAEAIVRGAQGADVSRPDKVVAGLCHYPGQSEPVSGLERGAMEISERALRQTFLPPWVAGIQRAGALGVMATYPSIDGVPAHGSRWLLTEILRRELGFRGLVLSEGGGIGTLVYEGVAADQKEGGEQALAAGVDVGISFEEGYMKALAESVEEGKTPVALVDRAVRRILEMKFRLGLFERPYVDEARAGTGVDRAAHRALALQAARESIVLLKNEGNLLPLKPDLRRIAVIGPNADDPRNQLGDYISEEIPQEIVTILAGIRKRASGAEVLYVKGCDVMGAKRDEIRAAADAARRSDVAIVVVGENERKKPDATNGEGRDVASLDLTGMQQQLVEAVQATGTPVVVVLVNGRALSTRWIAEHVPAVVEAWLPGEQGGHAVAEVLFGDRNPSGKLPVTIPRHVGQLPVYYNHRLSKVRRSKPGYADMSARPLYPFGHGLSYTQFAYRDLRVAPETIAPAGEARVSVEVANTGSRAGEEVVQLYVRDVVASVSRPVKELRGFRKVALKPGEATRVEFTLGPEDLQFLDRALKLVVEPGEFEIMVGGSSEVIGQRGRLVVRRSN